jgi:hypothetical protein
MMKGLIVKESTKGGLIMAEASRQAPPPWLFKNIINPSMKAILRSPLHGLLSGGLAILSFRGRKSGKQFSTPVAYHRLDEKSILVMTRSPWWKNLRNGESVKLRLQGRDYQAHPEVIEDNSVVWDYISLFLKEHNNPRRVGIMLSEDATPEEIRKEASDLLAIRFRLA